MVLYAVATCLLSMRAPRTDALLNGEQEPELDVVKHAVGADFVVDKVIQQRLHLVWGKFYHSCGLDMLLIDRLFRNSGL